MNKNEVNGKKSGIKDEGVCKRLTKKLTISFPLWLIYSDGYELYDDLEKVIIEHVERGFNCLRIDDGAGLIHDLEGRRLGEIEITDIFGEFEKIPRQQGIVGEPGKRDLLARLIELCEASKKHGVYIILSSWYFLHTYWFHPKGDEIEKTIYAIPPHERFMAFAKFQHYILDELEKRGLDDCIAFVEIFNEANGLPFVNGYGQANNLSDEELYRFRNEHEEAIEFLKKEHPQIPVAYDSYTPWDDLRQIPRNMDIYNFHPYFMWGIYDDVINEHRDELILNNITEEDVRRSREGRRPAQDDWYERIALYNNLDKDKILLMENYLEDKLAENMMNIKKNVDELLENVKNNLKNFKDVDVIVGEGVSYIGSKDLLWEEKSEAYWKLIEEVIKKYKDFEIKGTVIRTCCGPEDPSWTMCKDTLRKINCLFLQDE